MSKGGHYFANLCVASALVASSPSVEMALTAVATVLASSAPDQLEGVYYWSRASIFLGGRSARLSLVPHRTLTHWPIAWLIALVGCTLLLNGMHDAIGPRWFFALGRGVALGALVHLALDAFSPMGIPMLQPFGPRRNIATIYTTGSVRELLLLGPLALGSALVVFMHVGMFAAAVTKQTTALHF